PASGLGYHALGACHDGGQVVDGLTQPGFTPSACATNCAFSVADHRGGLADDLFGDAGQFTGDPPYRGLGLITLLCTTQPQLRCNRTGPTTRTTTPVMQPGYTHRATSGFDPPHAARHRSDSLGQQA